mmetsp:Transcript_8553/g.12549  ORF Transcript_8553/g.12549 Transcript_8553/m.12549 type:complete len:959 (-) Transcript_8553:121-2997(-)
MKYTNNCNSSCSYSSKRKSCGCASTKRTAVTAAVTTTTTMALCIISLVMISRFGVCVSKENMNSAFLFNGKQETRQRQSSTPLPSPSSLSFTSRKNFAVTIETSKGAFQPWKRKRGVTSSSSTTSPSAFFSKQNDEEVEETAMPSLSLSEGEDNTIYSHLSPSSSTPTQTLSAKGRRRQKKRNRIRNRLQSSNTALFALFKRFVVQDEEEEGIINTSSEQNDVDDDEDDDEMCFIIEHESMHGRQETICLDAVHVDILEQQEQNMEMANQLEDEDDETKSADEKSTRIEHDIPAVPSYKLPKRFHTNSEDVNGVIDDNDNEIEDGSSPVSLQHEIDENEDEINGGTIQHEDTQQPQHQQVHRGIIIFDNFSPFHGQYISRMAREAYNAGVVSVLSNYVTGYLYQERGLTDHLSMRLPSDEHIDEWVHKIPFEIVGILCESDSGLDDAEHLGEMLGLYPDRHDGFNLARRNKFLMNEVCRGYGLGGIVEQRLCESLEEAMEFAKELGVTNVDEGEEQQTINGAPILRSEEELLEEMEREEIQQLLNQEESIQKENEFMESIMDEFVIDQEQDNEEEQGHKSNSGVLSIATERNRQKQKYCVVKPTRGVASDDVFLCPSLQSVSSAFTKVHQSSIFGTMNGEKHESVLVQEFASGTEYAIDIVSKGGQHKVAALWKYDKRSINGAPFVYHATELVDADTKVGRAVCEYAMEALDALNVHWGLSHTEIIVEEDNENAEPQPRLVEVNCRQHNTDFAPLTTAAVGYNALDMLLAAYLGDADDFPPHTEHMRLVWNDLPDLPVTRAYGAIVHLASHVEGTIEEVNYEALEEIEGMPSVMAMEVYPQFLSLGSEIQKTVDIRSDTGWVHIMNDNEEQFLKDYNRIIWLMEKMFKVEEEEEVEEEERMGDADMEVEINGEKEDRVSVDGEYDETLSSSPANGDVDYDRNAMKMIEEQAKEDSQST